MSDDARSWKGYVSDRRNELGVAAVVLPTAVRDVVDPLIRVV